MTDSYCHKTDPVWQTLLILLLLLAVSIGIAVVVYWKLSNVNPRLYTLADFVEREVY